MKKLLSVLLCIVMVCALLPAAALAVEDLAEVKLTVDTPVEGQTPDEFKPVITTSDGRIYAYDWRDTKGNVLTMYETFKRGETYTLTVVVSCAKKFVPETTKIYLNGKLVTWEAFGVDSAKFRVDFTAKESPNLLDVTITVPEPVGGKSPDEAKPVLTSSDGRIYAYDWKDSKGNLVTAYDSFKWGETYTLIVVVSSSKKAVAGTTKAYINDEELTWEDFGVDSIRFRKNFTAAEPEGLSEVRITADTPADGQKASEAKPTLATTDCHIYASDWRDGKGEMMASSETFKGGETYTLVVVVSSLEAFVEGKTKAYINDEEVAWESFGVDSIRFRKEFTVPEVPKVTTPIDSLSLTVTAPTAGTSPVYSAVAGLGGKYTVDKAWTAIGATDGVGWAHLNSKTWSDLAGIVAPTDKFEEGEIYMAAIKVKPDEGYSFDAALNTDPSKALVNGYGAAHVETDGDGIIVYYVFPPAATVKKEITKVELTVTWPKLGEKAVLTAKLPADANYTLEGGKIGWFCDEDNAMIAEGAAFEAKTYIFSATLVPKEGYSFAADPELSVTLNGEPASIWNGEGGKAFVKKYVTLGLPNPFTDVKESDYFYNAVMWAYYADPQVTNGMTTTEFGPKSSVTRGQAVTFLWRAKGCPEPTSKTNPFVDVPENEYYYKAVLWAVEKGITKGTDDTHFTPSQTCSTAHILTFLYRTLEIGTDGWYQVAEAWAKGAGLLEGLNITVAPGVDCPRCDVVLFLYRAVGK